MIRITEKATTTPIKTIEDKSFPDGTPLIRYCPREDTKIAVVTWLYDNMGELFTVQCLVDKIKRTMPSVRIQLCIPYLPNARMDREKNPDDISTLQTMVKLLADLKADDYFFTDVHSQAFFDMFAEQYVDVEKPYISTDYVLRKRANVEKIKQLFQPDMLFYPDKGARTKYEKVHSDVFGLYEDHKEFLQLPVAYGEKIRNWETGEIEGLGIKGVKVKGKNILIVDDISSYGGTFYHSALKLKELGAKSICLLVTHAENSILQGELVKDNGLIDYIFTTDSIFTGEHKKIKLIEQWRT